MPHALLNRFLVSISTKAPLFCYGVGCTKDQCPFLSCLHICAQAADKDTLKAVLKNEHTWRVWMEMSGATPVNPWREANATTSDQTQEG